MTSAPIRIATWNVNSLKARLERVTSWIERAAPDILVLEETKLTDDEAPRDVFRALGYDLAHHGEGGRNGVAIASRLGVADVSVAFGGDDPSGESRMISARCGDLRVVGLYAPNGRVVGTPFFDAKLAWYDHLAAWLARTHRPDERIVLAGDLNVAPDDRDVWDPKACHGGTHVTPEERSRFAGLLDWGLVDAYRAKHEEAGRYTWWDYRAGYFFKNFGMRIDHVLVSRSLAGSIVHAEIDREARKGKPTPSDHAPLVVDLFAPGKPFDAGWEGAEKRIAERRAKGR
jgi:exodeoxyribonuclease III